MSIWILAAQGLLAAGFVAAVAYPFVGRKADGAHLPEKADDSEQAREGLMAQKHLAYEAIKELEFDLASGKLSEDDYQSMRRDLEAEAIGVLKELDLLEGPEAQAASSASPLSCPSCGSGIASEHAFCPACGTKLR